MDVVPSLIVTAVTSPCQGHAAFVTGMKHLEQLNRNSCEKHRLILVLVKPLAELGTL